MITLILSHLTTYIINSLNLFKIPSARLIQSRSIYRTFGPQPNRTMTSTIRAASPSDNSNSNQPASKIQKLSSTTDALQILLDPQHPNAKLPTRGSPFAAGYDLYASESKSIPKGGRSIIQTGIRLKIPNDCYARVAPRSGLAVKHGIDVGAGVVDSDYRGLLGVLLFNFGEQDFVVNTGDRIAQLVIEQIRCLEVEEVKSLEESVRGEGGFGSTGGFGSAVNEKK